ncbi:unnamed protein product [Brassicogethes aeneus]|uniref:Outer dynein arm-docking complex subunit 4 n=1 Tax=Brassicogethes aeneus TaxID=1431903 RepID=A0A9P0FIV8_BRAAE|nr:unnamed protein product [Brassicogethes aeneus]
MATSIQQHVNRLNVAREAELLQSFVRVNVDDDVEVDNGGKERINLPQEAKKDDKDEGDVAKAKNVTFDDTNRQQEGSSASKEFKKKVKRRRRRSTRHEELYCDKDRAAAVNLGSKDIKQSLKLKRKQDRSEILQIPEEAEPATFLALGKHEMRRGDFRISFNFISKALELNPFDKNALVARSKCLILMGRPEEALIDAETALKEDPKFLRAIYQKAEAMYYLGNFEHSLMYYHRGLHIRPDHEGFKLGVHKAQKAIENALGSGFGGRVSSGTTSIVGSLDSNPTSSGSSRSNSGSIQSTPKSRSSKISTPTTINNNNNNNNNSNNNVRKLKSTKDSRLLRELGKDKEYLDSLINNPNIKCKFKENDDKIETCIKETMDYLNKRQEFWRQQMPPKLN